VKWISDHEEPNGSGLKNWWEELIHHTTKSIPVSNDLTWESIKVNKTPDIEKENNQTVSKM